MDSSFSSFNVDYGFSWHVLFNEHGLLYEFLIDGYFYVLLSLSIWRVSVDCNVDCELVCIMVLRVGSYFYVLIM